MKRSAAACALFRRDAKALMILNLLQCPQPPSRDLPCLSPNEGFARQGDAREERRSDGGDRDGVEKESWEACAATKWDDDGGGSEEMREE